MVEIYNPLTLDMHVDRRGEGLTREGFPIEQEKVIREGNIAHYFWSRTQIGMVNCMIKPLYQDEDAYGRKLEKGDIRIIDLGMPVKQPLHHADSSLGVLPR